MTGARVTRGIDRGEAFEIEVDGAAVTAYPGESLAAVLFAAALRVLGERSGGARSRGYFCGMGLCWECLVTVEGQASRACMTEARPGLRVTTGHGGKEIP